MGKQALAFVFFSILGIAIFGFAYRNSIKEEVPPSIEEVSIDEKVDSLLALMTLEEKVGQLVQYSGYDQLTGPGEKQGSTLEKHNRIKNGLVGSMLNVVGVESVREAQKLAVENSRLGIPMVFAYDVIHGYKTIFPIPLGEAASWDLEIIRKSAAVAAKEASAAGLSWTFAPMVDISRDARWGRVMEGAGEDPYFGSEVARARVLGFQGTDLSDPTTLAACAKHFAGYGFAEAGRDYNTVDISDHTLHNVVLPPFKACVDAGVATVMNGFNELGGVPVTGNAYLQREILKGDWEFEGAVVSDWSSIAEMRDHGVAKDRKHAAELAIKAGSDIDMEGYCYEGHLAELVKEGKVDEKLVDDAVRRVLRLKFKLGLFEDPYKYCDPEREVSDIMTKEHLEISRDVARRSIVLLKNQEEILPLSKDISSIAVIGPLAADKDSPLGNWRAQAVDNSAVSLLEGMKNAVGPNTTLKYAQGCQLAHGTVPFHAPLTINQTDRSLIPEAVQAAKNAEVVVLAIGEVGLQSGEGRSQVNIGLHGVQQELLQAVTAANPNTVVVLMNGRPLAVPEVEEKAAAIVEAWHLGSEAGNAIADVLFGKYNPSGKLPMSFPRHVGQLPLYYAQKYTGRPGPDNPGEVFYSHYTDESNEPLWPFGYGLSYTTFVCGDLALDKKKLSLNETLQITVEVSNTGKYDGEEVLQLYVADLIGSRTRPKRELKGFKKIFIPKGQSRKVEFQLDPKDLAFYTLSDKWEVEPGQFKVFVGTDSNASLEADFEVIPTGSR